MKSTKTKQMNKDLDLLFEDQSIFSTRSEIIRLSALNNESKVITKNAKKETSSGNSIVGLDQEVLNSIQNLFDAQYSSGGFKASQELGKSMSSSFSSEEIEGIIHAKQEKQITGIIADKVMAATGAVEFIKNNVEIPQSSGNNKKAVVSVWKQGWESIKRNVGLLGEIFQEVWKKIWGYFQKHSWYVAAGFAIFYLARKLGRYWSKIFKLLRFIPGVSMVIDLTLAVKNIYYVQKEIVNEDWNKTMMAIDQPGFVVSDPGELRKLNYPNSVARVIGNAIQGLTRKISSAFKIGQVALKCTAAGFSCSKVFNQILEQEERQFLSGRMSAEEFALSVANHIKASRKIKLVCSEMIGLICNVSSAIFDLATATGVGIIVTIIGNLVIAGIDMGLREGIIGTCKAFEDYWSKRLSDYGSALAFYSNFSKISQAKAGGNSEEASMLSTKTLALTDKNSVDISDISKENSKAMEDARTESRKKSTPKLDIKKVIKEEEDAA